MVTGLGEGTLTWATSETTLNVVAGHLPVGSVETT
jgi:hypothetical protein